MTLLQPIASQLPAVPPRSGCSCDAVGPNATRVAALTHHLTSLNGGRPATAEPDFSLQQEKKLHTLVSLQLWSLQALSWAVNLQLHLQAA